MTSTPYATKAMVIILLFMQKMYFVVKKKKTFIMSKINNKRGLQQILVSTYLLELMSQRII